MESLNKNIDGNNAPQLLNVGEAVKDRRTSGEVDEGWQITSLGKEDAVVQKKLVGKAKQRF